MTLHSPAARNPVTNAASGWRGQSEAWPRFIALADRTDALASQYPTGMIVTDDAGHGSVGRRFAHTPPRDVSRRGCSPALPLLLAVMIVGGGTGSVRALDVDRVLWGFDGRVQIRRFNPVSILVSNPLPTPFDGTFQLRRSTGAGNRVGALIVSPVFVSPFSSRWVQLYPYVIDGNEQWRLRWDGGGEIMLSRPRVAKGPLPILLVAEDDIAGRGAIKRFPENLFPPSVTETDVLKIAVLDHTPRWGTARSRAFLDWLSGGGTLHLLQGSDGRSLEFPAGLDALNSPLQRFPVGAGTVVRHAVPLRSADRKFVQTMLMAAGQSAKPPSISKTDGKTKTEPSGKSDADDAEDDWQQSNDSLYDNLTLRLFDSLKKMTHVRHPWLAIYLLSFVYLGLMFPGFLILGRSRVNVRWVYMAFIGVIGLFSLVFLIVGRRGVDEQTVVRSVMTARVLSDGSWDVTEWANVFVRNGATFSIEHSGTGRLYSTAQDFEAVNGTITSGTEGRLTVDIPPFSRRPFVARRKVVSKPWNVAIDQWQAGAGLNRLTLTVGDQFPSAERLLVVKVLYRDRLYSMRLEDGRLTLADQGVRLSVYFDNHDLEETTNIGVFESDADDDMPVEQMYRRLLSPLIARSLELTTGNQAEAFVLPPNRLRLFVYAALPEKLSIANGALGNQSGYVVYRMDLFESVTP